MIPIIGGVSSGIFLIVFMLVGGFGVMAGGRRSADFILIWMLLMYVIYILLLIAVNVVRTILLVLINKQILEQFTSENMALVHSVVSQFVPLYEAFCFFAMRNKNFREGKEPVLTPLQRQYRQFPQYIQQESRTDLYRRFLQYTRIDLCRRFPGTLGRRAG